MSCPPPMLLQASAKAGENTPLPAPGWHKDGQSKAAGSDGKLTVPQQSFPEACVFTAEPLPGCEKPLVSK